MAVGLCNIIPIGGIGDRGDIISWEAIYFLDLSLGIVY